MESNLLIKFLIALGTFQAFFIAFVLLSKRPHTLFQKLFSTFLIIEGITLLERLSVETGLIEHIPHLLGISYPISFLKPPILLFMALSLTQVAFRLRRKDFLHWIPFAILLLTQIPFLLQSATAKIKWAEQYKTYVPNYQNFAFYFGLVMFVYIGVYVVMSIRRLRQFRIHIKNNPLLNWFHTVLIIYTGFLIFHLSYFVLQPLLSYPIPYINQISMLLMSLIIQSIAYQLIGQSNILNITPPNLDDIHHREKQEQLIIDLFEKEKIFMDDTLSLSSFSEKLELSSSEISKIINQKFNCSFQNLVAQYRLKEAKKIMDHAPSDGLKLIDVAYQVGFSNKVSFYRTFKKYEGFSPSAYLENQKKLKSH